MFKHNKISTKEERPTIHCHGDDRTAYRGDVSVMEPVLCVHYVICEVKLQSNKCVSTGKWLPYLTSDQFNNTRESAHYRQQFSVFFFVFPVTNKQIETDVRGTKACESLHFLVRRHCRWRPTHSFFHQSSFAFVFF